GLGGGWRESANDRRPAGLLIQQTTSRPKLACSRELGFLYGSLNPQSPWTCERLVAGRPHIRKIRQTLRRCSWMTSPAVDPENCRAQSVYCPRWSPMNQRIVSASTHCLALAAMLTT